MIRCLQQSKSFARFLAWKKKLGSYNHSRTRKGVLTHRTHAARDGGHSEEDGSGGNVIIAGKKAPEPVRLSSFDSSLQSRGTRCRSVFKGRWGKAPSAGVYERPKGEEREGLRVRGVALWHETKKAWQHTIALTDVTTASLLGRRQDSRVDATPQEEDDEVHTRQSRSKSPARASGASAPTERGTGSWKEAKGAAAAAIEAAQKEQGADDHEHHLWDRVRTLMRQRRKRFEDMEDQGANSIPVLRARGNSSSSFAGPNENAKAGTEATSAQPSPPASKEMSPAPLSPSGWPPSAPVAVVQDQHRELLDNLVKTHTREARSTGALPLLLFLLLLLLLLLLMLLLVRRLISILRETIAVMKEERQAQDWQLMDALAQAKSANPSILR